MSRLFLIVFVSISLFACGANEDGVESVKSTPTQLTALTRDDISTHLLFGTGGVSGVYFPIGGVICRLLNRHKTAHKIRCSLESTGGSIYNLRELRKGNFDLVVAQSDWQFHAYQGSSTFAKEGANPDLRTVFALEADPLALLVKQASDIQTFDDLANRDVGFGYSRSIQHRIISDLMAEKKWTKKNFSSMVSMNDAHQINALCTDKLDAVLLVSSSLTDHLKTATEDCQLRLVPITGPEVDAVIAKKSYYRHGAIPRNLYIPAKQDTPSFGLGATFVAMQSTSPKAIYYVVKEVVENFKDFQSLHPTLRNLKKKELPTAGVTAPLHAGALRYYREARLIR